MRIILFDAVKSGTKEIYQIILWQDIILCNYDYVNCLPTVDFQCLFVWSARNVLCK